MPLILSVPSSKQFEVFLPLHSLPPLPSPSTFLTRRDLFLHWLCKSGHFRVNQDLKRAGWHEVCIKEWYVDKWQRHGFCGNKNTLGDIFVRGPHFTASKMQKHQEIRLLSLNHDCRSRSVCTLLPTHWIKFSFHLAHQKLSTCNAGDENLGFSIVSGLAGHPSQNRSQTLHQREPFVFPIVWLAKTKRKLWCCVSLASWEDFVFPMSKNFCCCCCLLGFHYFKSTWSLEKLCKLKHLCLLNWVVAGQVCGDPGVLTAPLQR